MKKDLIYLRVEKFLFGQGLSVDDYFIEQTPISEVICYRNKEGRDFDLLIDDVELAIKATERLKELGVRVMKFD
jgi:hypothetical protein